MRRVWPPACSNCGALLIYRGNSDGLPSITPAFIYYGIAASQYLDYSAGGVNTNGDKYDDIVLSEYS